MNAPAPLASPEVECAILSTLLLHNRAIDQIADRLRPEYFSSDLHRAIYVEICAQIGKGLHCDTVTVFQAMNGRIELADLNGIAQYVSGASSVNGYIKVLADCHFARQLAAASHEIRELAMDASMPVNERIERAQGHLAQLTCETSRDEWVSAHEGMVSHTSIIESRESGQIHSMETGLPDLDDMLEGGLRAGSLVVIGGRPSHGKTALGMSIGLHMAAHCAVGLLSLEMPHRDIRDRMTAMLGRVPLSHVLRPAHSDRLAWDKVVEGIESARSLRLHVCDQSGLNIHQLRAKARALKRKHGLDVLLVDYIGLMSGLDSKQYRAYQIEEITKGLKSLAKEMDIAVIALSQLNRNIEQRVNREPMLSDFRDSGSIEQDADIVLALHREIADKPQLDGLWQEYAKLMVLKNRQGRTGIVHLHYEGSQTRFSKWSGPAPQGHAQKTTRGFSD